MITEQLLLDSGYNKRVTNPDRAFDKYANAFFQKCVRNIKGDKKLYFIDIFQYERREDRPESFMTVVHFYLDKEHEKYMEMKLSCFTDLEELEEFVDNAYGLLNCSPYDDD